MLNLNTFSFIYKLELKFHFFIYLPYIILIMFCEYKGYSENGEKLLYLSKKKIKL